MMCVLSVICLLLCVSVHTAHSESDPTPNKHSPINESINAINSEAADCHNGSAETHTYNGESSSGHSGESGEGSPCTSTTASSATMTSPTDSNETSTGAPNLKNVVSVLLGVTVVGALLMCGFFFRKKLAKDRKKDHAYESVEDVKPAANENNYEAVYVLAGDSAIVSLGKKTDTEPQSSSETKVPKNQGEAVYSTVQKDTTMPRDVSPTNCETQQD